MFAFRAIIEKELSRISSWMSKTSKFLSHDLSSWQKEYCLFLTAFSNKKVSINSSTLPIPHDLREKILGDPLAKRRTKFYWDAVQLTFNSLRYRMCFELQKVFSSAFDLYSIDMMTLKVSDRAFFAPFRKYMELTKLMGKIPDKSFISMTRCEDDLSAKGLRDTLMTKVWVKWAPIISGASPYNPPASSRDAPMESSLIPVSAVIKRLFFVASTVNSGIIAKRLAYRTIIPAASFGFRTMIWLWAGEMFYSSVFMLSGFMILYALITYINSESLSYAFSPIILLTSSYFSIVYEKLYSILYPSTVSSYGMVH